MKKQEVQFHEIQRFRQWWLWLPLLIMTLALIYNLANHWIKGGDINYFALVFPTTIMLLVILLFALSKLETFIKEDGIYVKFFPFHWSFRKFEWQDLEKAHLRQYSALSEFGGWGVRWGLGGKAYNVAGKWGIQLLTKKGNSLLIGTRQADEVRAILAAIHKV